MPAIAAMRFALGSFFVLSGVHKLTNKERHKTFVETLGALASRALAYCNGLFRELNSLAASASRSDFSRRWPRLAFWSFVR